MRKLRELALQARDAIQQGKHQTVDFGEGKEDLAWFFKSEMLDQAKEIHGRARRGSGCPFPPHRRSNNSAAQ